MNRRLRRTPEELFQIITERLKNTPSNLNEVENLCIVGECIKTMRGLIMLERAGASPTRYKELNALENALNTSHASYLARCETLVRKLLAVATKAMDADSLLYAVRIMKYLTPDQRKEIDGLREAALKAMASLPPQR